MSKIKKLNNRRLKKAGHLVISDPVYVNGESVTIPSGRLSVGSRIIFNSLVRARSPGKSVFSIAMAPIGCTFLCLNSLNIAHYRSIAKKMGRTDITFITNKKITA